MPIIDCLSKLRLARYGWYGLIFSVLLLFFFFNSESSTSDSEEGQLYFFTICRVTDSVSHL